MVIDKPQCSLDTCRYYFDGNCTNEKRYKICEFAYFKELEVDGRLIELPCKVGDTVWKISTEQDSYDEPPYKIIRPITFRIDCLHAMGKNIFITKEEAEARLEELKGV